MTKIQELGGIEQLPQPTISRDLAPSDPFLGGSNFEDVEAVEVGLTE